MHAHAGGIDGARSLLAALRAILTKAKVRTWQASLSDTHKSHGNGPV
jgi:hypothetical protein